VRVERRADLFRRPVQHRADLVERQVDRAHSADQPGVVKLVPRVPPVTGVRVDLNRLEQTDLVVVAQRRDGQAGRDGEPADVQEILVHPLSLKSQVAGESTSTSRHISARHRRCDGPVGGGS
jgi:hypothetical protein